ncbi:MAG TPA: NUDIX domain-containing protein [Actinophytocola sp.]|uniref:NUDIX domain-containing protein n=1 Tax=Actinophytocola sp. TaxID=1872138 RepID=UPI002DDCF7A0|nr:NUDIX domain-containing protein [Actinophytocola sp.]HEV2782158.1 NUDIX domain-containing protein [Actinophytocola sp.]
MKEVGFLVAGVVLGGFVSLVLTVRFEDRWKARLRRRGNARLAGAVRRMRAEADGPVHVAGFATSVYLVEGDGELVLEPEDIRIRLRGGRAELPGDVVSLRDRVVKELRAARRASVGVAPSWDSRSLVALRGYRIARAGVREDARITLDVTRVDYATFAATVLRLDAEFEWNGVPTTLRRAYLQAPTLERRAVAQPVPFLANGVGIALVAFTDDDRLLLARRRVNTSARGGERDVGVVEGMHADLDLAARGGGLNPYETAVRGCREELGVNVEPADVRLLGFAVDMAYYQWNFVGFVELRKTSDEVLEAQRLHAKDRWEAKLEPVAIDPEVVFTRIRHDGMWDMGLVATYLALCTRCGVGAVARAAERVLGSRPARPPWRR